jgi:hypothetical protein
MINIPSFVNIVSRIGMHYATQRLQFIGLCGSIGSNYLQNKKERNITKLFDLDSMLIEYKNYSCQLAFT